MTELLPCPFCGSCDIEIQSFKGWSGVHHKEAICKACHGKSGPVTGVGSGAAISAWNTRKPKEATQNIATGKKPTIHELEAILDEKDAPSIEILPNGEVRAVGVEPKEDWQPIEWNERTQKIMGWMCFQTARFSHKLIELGLYPKQPDNHKAEYEQAIFMHWALNLEAEHGAAWFDVGQKILTTPPKVKP